jgi:hypothetical protein
MTDLLVLMVFIGSFCGALGFAGWIAEKVEAL